MDDAILMNKNSMMGMGGDDQSTPAVDMSNMAVNMNNLMNNEDFKNQLANIVDQIKTNQERTGSSDSNNTFNSRNKT